MQCLYRIQQHIAKTHISYTSSYAAFELCQCREIELQSSYLYHSLPAVQS